MKPPVHIALFFLLPATSYGGEQAKHTEPAHTTGVEALSPDLRDLLSQEMQALQKGMISIIPAYGSGNWAEIETTARNMKNSYILKKNLTQAQAKELHTVLPQEFIEKDQWFHYLAGMLEHAAKNKKPELINFYFSEMNESCAGCHSAFATHKFPAFKQKQKEQDEHTH